MKVEECVHPDCYCIDYCEAKDPHSEMCRKPLHALRQYLHNDGSGFVFGYDEKEIDLVVNNLLSAISLLREDMETLDRMPFNTTEEAANFAEESLVKHRKFMQKQPYRRMNDE